MLEPVHKTVIVKGSRAGLGDLLRAVTLGILYAKNSNRRVFVDWSDGYYSEMGKNAFPEAFEVRGFPMSESCPVSESIAPAIWRGYLDRSLSELVTETGWEWRREEAIGRYSIDVTKLDYEEDNVVLWDFDQLEKLAKIVLPWTSCWHPWIERAVFRRFFLPHVKPRTEILQAVKDFKRDHFSSGMIGVHIRHGSDARCGQRIPMDIYESHLAGLLRLYPDAGIFLATDQRAAEAHMCEKFPRLVSRAKWFPANGESLHISSEVSDRLRRLDEALMDIWLLSACDFLLFPAESSFGTVAACIGNARLRRIYPLAPDSHWHPPWRQGLNWASISKSRIQANLHSSTRQRASRLYSRNKT